MTKRTKGVVAAGHEETARVAADTLRDGGNAIDAAVAGMFAACVCEPVLASLGGGGFAMVRPAGAESPVLYDFFAQTPWQKRVAAEVDFREIVADFGPVQ
ncbi:MAG: gamma-glutamyltransferase, partial [Methyloligellaceae bacterium]